MRMAARRRRRRRFRVDVRSAASDANGCDRHGAFGAEPGEQSTAKFAVDDPSERCIARDDRGHTASERGDVRLTRDFGLDTGKPDPGEPPHFPLRSLCLIGDARHQRSGVRLTAKSRSPAPQRVDPLRHVGLMAGGNLRRAFVGPAIQGGCS